MRQEVQLKLDTKFGPQNISVDLGENTNGANKYVVYEIIRRNNSDFADNKAIIEETNIIVRCYSTKKSDLEGMADDVIDALKDYECLDKGSDIPAEIGADIFGIELEFMRYGF